jgi:hypothetical protein
MAFGGPNQTPTPHPVVDYTPQKDYLSFSGLINQYYNPTTYTGTTNKLTPSDVLSGLLILTNAGAITASLPSAADLIPQIQGGQGPATGISQSNQPGLPNLNGGNGIRFYVKAGGAGAVTVSVGTGGTLVGTGAVTAGSVKTFLLIITGTGDTPTYTVYSLGQSAQ